MSMSMSAFQKACLLSQWIAIPFGDVLGRVFGNVWRFRGLFRGWPKRKSDGNERENREQANGTKACGDGVSKSPIATNFCSIGLFSVVGRLGTHRGWVTTLVIRIYGVPKAKEVKSRRRCLLLSWCWRSIVIEDCGGA